jgi:hypothetical protein
MDGATEAHRENIYIYRISVGKPEGKSQLEDLDIYWSIIKMKLNEI